MSVVEQHARAHVVTDRDALVLEEHEAVPVVLRYDPDGDPGEVRIDVPGAHEWSCPRDLLEQGLRTPAGSGGVRVWPCGRVQAVVEFHSAQGVSVVEFDAKTLLRFLRRARLAATTPARG